MYEILGNFIEIGTARTFEVAETRFVKRLGSVGTRFSILNNRRNSYEKPNGMLRIPPVPKPFQGLCQQSLPAALDVCLPMKLPNATN